MRPTQFFFPPTTEEVLKDLDKKNCQAQVFSEKESFINDITKQLSPIQEFYKDQTIFITGATGFLGTLLVEKILRCCPQIRKLILLIRQRGAKSIEDRIKDYFHDEIFDKLRLENPNYFEKVDIVCGQLEADSYGLTPIEENRLVSQTSIIFHVAATVRFDEPMRSAYNINVRGTQTMISLARKMHRLKSFVHVSTAFSNCNHRYIKEKFYPPDFTAQELSIFINSSTDEEMALLKDHLIDKKPNTYTLTKATAEHLIKEACEELPISVFRPSIVFPTLQEPIPVWLKGFNGVIAICIGNATGLIRAAIFEPNVSVDIVPADRTINAMIALAWYQTTQQDQHEDKKIYNYVSCNDNKVYFKDMTDKIGKFFDESEESCKYVLWKRNVVLTRSITMYYILMYIFHCIPGVVFSIAEKLTGRKPVIMKLYRKMFFITNTLRYFANNWQFDNNNTRDMVAAINDEDSKWCDSSMANFSWDPMLCNLHRGVGKYLLSTQLTKDYYNTKTKFIFRADNVLRLLIRGSIIYFVLSSVAMFLNAIL